MTITEESTPLDQFVSYLKGVTGREPSKKDAIFHHNFAKYRHQSRHEHAGHTWISFLLRDGMSDDARRELYPSCFDLGNTRTDCSNTGSLGELLDDINGPCKKLRGERLGGKNKRDLETVLKGIKMITGRNVSQKSANVPLTDLRVIKRLYQLKERDRNRNRSSNSHIFNFIGPPRKPKHHTLEFKDTFPDPRNPDGTLLFCDLLSYISVQMSDERLGRIGRTLRSLPETLLAIEKENATISAMLTSMFHEDREAKASALRQLAESINTYAPHKQDSTNPLDECIYTYLRKLRFVHFAVGYEQAIKKSQLPSKIATVEFELDVLCIAVSYEVGRHVFRDTPATSVDGFAEFVLNHAADFIGLVQKATGFVVERRHLAKISERAKRILHLYHRLHLGEKNNKIRLLSVLDCAAALCTVHQEETAKTEHQAYWYAQKTQPKNLLLQLKIKRRIHELYEHDYVPHGIHQILYNRWCSMHAALVGTEGELDYLDAWMSFQVARIKKYAQCLQSNDVDVISKSLVMFSMECLHMPAHLNIRTTSLVPTLFDSIDQWISGSDEDHRQ